MLEKYISFLKVGSNKWPIDTFKVLGIDLKDEKVYVSAIEYYNDLINKFYEIYNGGE